MLSKSSRTSSSFEGAIKNIRDGEYVRVDGGIFELVGHGLALFGGAPAVPQSPEELRRHWRESLPGNVAPAVFEVLVAAYPDPLSKAEIAERTGSSLTSSTFEGALTILRRHGLAEGERGVLRATPILFA
jgi:hypothetical protein